MKAKITGLLKGRITRWGFLGALLITVGATGGWMNQAQHQLGGAFVFSGGGLISHAIQVPLDPGGRTAAARINTFTYGADLAGLLAMVGADTAAEASSQVQMISRDTAKYAAVGYYTKQGNPPLICALYVLTGTLKFTGRDTLVLNYSADVYPGPANALGLPNADADGDGYPDPGATALVSFPGGATGKRVPIP